MEEVINGILIREVETKNIMTHKEEWGTFLDVKHWPKIKNPKKYAGQRVVIKGDDKKYFCLKISSLNEYSVQIRLGSNLGGFFYFRKKEDAYGRKSGSDGSK